MSILFDEGVIFMKKFLCVLMAAMLACGVFAGCGNTDTSSEPEQKLEIKTPADLDGLRIGTQEGTTGDTYAQKTVKNAKVSSYKKGVDALIDLENGKLDCVIWDELPSQKAVEKRDKVKILDMDLTSEEYAIAVKKGNQELLDSINASIKRMKEDGTLDKISAVYIAEDETATLPEVPAATTDKKLVMGTNADFAPFEFREGTEVVGFDVSMAEQIAADMGATLEVEDMDFGGIIAAVQSGKVDMGIAGMTVDEERLKNVDFSDTYFTAKQVVVVKK